jgi:DNA-binding beta-propeller fold protein YncE
MLCFLLLVNDLSHAQLVGKFMDYVGMISTDEDRNNLSLPSFIYAEPVMNEIYILDSKGRVMIFKEDKFHMFTLDHEDGLYAPLGLTVDEKGTLYVPQNATKNKPRHRISVLNACLKWERDIFIEGFEGSERFLPHRLAVDRNGKLYVAASFFGGVLVLDNDGHFLEFLSPEEGGKKANLTNVVIDKNGNIYLVSEDLGRIFVYDENRQFLFKFGIKGGSTGKLSRPRSVGVDTVHGRIYVIDRMRHTIAVYDNEGNYLFEFGGKGWGTGWFQFPNDIAVDSEGRVWVADLFNDRVQIFKPRFFSKKPIEMQMIATSGQTPMTKTFSYDALLGYNLQQRMRTEQHNQEVRFQLP